MKNTKPFLAGAAILLGVFFGWRAPSIASGVTQQAYNLIENSGSALIARSTLNMTGSGVTCADNSSSHRTDCTIPGGGGGSGITALTQDVSASGSGSVAATVIGLEAVPFCGGFAPTNAQFLQYTTGSSPNPCYTSAAGGGSGSFSAAPPYLSDGSHFFVAATGYQATKPTATPSWINGITPTSAVSAPNGDYVFSGPGTYWQTQTATVSVEAELQTQALQNNTSGQSGIWIYDSTNFHIWFWGPAFSSANPGQPELVLLEYNYSGSGNPTFGTDVVFTGFTPLMHLKLIVAAGTLSFQVSLNGGQTLTTLITESIGTVSQAGFAGSESITDVYSLKVN
jgi:hypothetical protein